MVYRGSMCGFGVFDAGVRSQFLWRYFGEKLLLQAWPGGVATFSYHGLVDNRA